jgi:DNA-binding MarR family transcriptional regulator
MKTTQNIAEGSIRALRTVLGLSIKEERVLLALQNRPHQSVLELAPAAKVSRPSVYDILKKLKRRGLVKSNIVNGRRRFSLESPRSLSDTLYRLKKDLLGFADGREEMEGVTDGLVVVYRGKEAVRQKIFEIFSSHSNERFLGYQGFDDSISSWFSIFSPEEISDINRLIKQRRLITEAVLPDGWLRSMFDQYGLAWAKDYEGRTAATSYISSEYFDNQCQLFAFKDAIYLIALKDQMIIELRHSDIQKMILTFYRFMRDHGRSVDLNGELRNLIDKHHNLRIR